MPNEKGVENQFYSRLIKTHTHTLMFHAFHFYGFDVDAVY